MNFDRKIDYNRGKLAGNAAGSAEFPPVMDGEEAQPGNSARSDMAARRGAAEPAYSSGAFPALDIAYPGHNARRGAAGFAAGGRSDNIQYSSRENQVNLNPGRGAGPLYDAAGRPPQTDGVSGGAGAFAAGFDHQQEAAAADNAAGKGQIMADDRRIADRDGGGGRGAGFAAGRDNSAYSSASGRPEYSGTEQNPRPRRDNFADAGFRGGLNADEALQAAYFDPSDYDYNYDPAAEAEAARRAEAQAAAIRPMQPPANAGEYSAPQAGLYARQSDYAPSYAHSYGRQSASQDYAPQAQPAYAPAQPPFYEETYPPQAGADDYYAEPDYGYAEPQQAEYARAQDNGYAAGDNLAYSPQDNPYAAAPYAENEPPAAASGDFYQNEAYAPQEQAPYAAASAALPFDEAYPEENVHPADDYGRLEGDVADMDRLAGPFPPVADGRGPAGQQDFVPLKRGGGAPQNQDRAAAVPPLAADEKPAPAQSSRLQAEPADNFTADDPYNDELYDWAPPSVDAAAAPQARQAAPQKQQKSRKLVYVAAAVIVVIAAAAGVYLKYGSSISGGSGPVVIHKTGGNYKVKAEDKTAVNNSREQSVSDGVSGAAAGGQKTLIDKTETPVEAQKMEERLPFNEQKPFNQSEADNLVQTAVAQATPVHIVPSVRVDADRKITASSAGSEKVLIPALAGAVPNSAPAAAARPMTEAQAEPAAAPVQSAAPAAAKPAAAVPRHNAAAPAAAAPKAAPPVKTAAASAAAGSFSMQISSQPSKEAAEASLREAKKHLSADLAGKIMIVPAAIAGKGTYYRVRIPARSRDEASAMCEKYKQDGGHCFIAR